MKKTHLRLCAPLLVEGLEDRGKVIGGTSRRVAPSCWWNDEVELWGYPIRFTESMCDQYANWLLVKSHQSLPPER